jgi:GH25 family lysozyme M1 (1,4-beta-N-acetylmuramidase)
VQFVFNRACYGTNPADDDGASFVHNHDALKRLGIPMGAYQFYLFGQDGAAQAQHFLEAADGRYGTLFPVIDVEEESAAQGNGGTVEERIANLAAYSAAIEKGLGCKPIIYTNSDSWSTYFGDTDGFAGHLLWVASWGSPGKIALPGGFRSAQLQQYADDGCIDGFNGNVDLDCLLGPTTIADLTR